MRNYNDSGYKKSYKNDFNRRSKSKKLRQAKCLASGAMHLLFRVSLLFGIAPVRFETKRVGRLVSVSRAVSVLHCIISTCIITGAVTGLALDFSQHTQDLGDEPTDRFLWVLNFFLVMLNIAVAVYKAPMRIGRVIWCLDEVQKLNIEEKSTNRNSEEWKKSAFLVLFTATSITLTVADIVVCMDRANNKQFFTFLCSTMYFLGYLIAQILEVQFICICSEVNKNLKSLNDVLEEAGNAVRQQDKNVLIPINYENVAANTICSAVDTLMIKKRKRSAVTPSTPISPKMIPEVIHQFIMKYHRICAVVDRLSSCFGLELLVIITTCMMHLVSMPYHMILLMNKRGMQLHQLLLMVASCVWYVFRTIAMVEQGHTTEAEVERTSWLVSEIMLSSTDDEIQDELEKFSRYLLMNKVGYSLLGACTLNRGLALSIFGTVATYLVVIVQFQLSEQ